MNILQYVTAVLGVFFIVGPLLNLSSHPHWFIRGWDFPRLQTAGFAFLIGLAHAYVGRPWAWLDGVLLAGLAWTCAYQIYKIFPYTRLSRKEVQRARSVDRERCVRLMVCNVEMCNERYEEVKQLIRQENPDVALLVEVDQKWADQLKQLDYPHQFARPQDNCYGMMLLSRLEPVEAHFRNIVKQDIPSLEIVLTLRNGKPFRLYGLHPEPPEPLRDQDATPRDAELILVAREIEKRRESEMPVIVLGDLNDVAWSSSTRLFLDVSRLLDPRRGRGLYNTFNAKSRFWRFPLDHVFHSQSFELVQLRILPSVGSDHFPVLIELQYCEAARQEQPTPTPDSADQAEAQEKIERQQAEEGVEEMK